MRGNYLAIVGCLAPLGGCHIFQNTARNVINEPIQYLDERHLEKQLRKDARHAWAEVCRQYPKRSFTDDFVDGFCDGYTDYLDNGGTAQVPAVPPPKYRRTKFLNPEGWERTRQYFLGFKYGMDVAIDTGCRTFLTVPVVLPEVPPPVDPNITVLPSPPDTSAPSLPTPRPVTPTSPGGSTDPKTPPKTPDVPGKAGDKEKTPVEPISIPIPIPEPSDAPPSNPPGAKGHPSGVEPPAEVSRPRPLLPTAAPTGPLYDLPPPRPPVFDPPDPGR